MREYLPWYAGTDKNKKKKSHYNNINQSSMTYIIAIVKTRQTTPE